MDKSVTSRLLRVAVLALGLGVGACGIKGDLYLPDPVQTPQTTEEADEADA